MQKLDLSNEEKENIENICKVFIKKSTEDIETAQAILKKLNAQKK